MTGNSLIGNTSQFMIDATGKRVVLDLSHCVCCDQTVEEICGECRDVIGSTVTIDLGTTNFIDNPDESLIANCETECNDLSGQFILNQNGPCSYTTDYDLLCPGYDNPGNTWRIDFEAAIAWLHGPAGWYWYLDIIVLRPSVATAIYRLRYRKLTTTLCTNQTYTLDKTNFWEGSNNPFLAAQWPCSTSGFETEPVFYDRWPWPNTVNLITP